MPRSSVDPVQEISLRKEWFSLSSPIGLIGAFTAIVDVALILAAIFIDDPDARVLLVLFAAVAFFYVTTWAFHLLKFQPEVLYGPHQYEGGTTALAYAEAVNRNRFLAQRVRATTTIEETVSTATQSSDAADGTSELSRVETKEVSTSQSASLETLREGEYLTLVVEDEHRMKSYFGPEERDKRGPESKRIRFDPIQWVGTFIVTASEEYSRLGYFTTPESYGLNWMMRDRKTGVILSDIGFSRHYGATVVGVDYRRLYETSVTPGMELEPVELPPPPLPLPPATSPNPFEQWLLGEEVSGRLKVHRPRSHLRMPPGPAPPSFES